MKILMVGAGPLPLENRGVANAAGLRTRQFLEGIKTRHDVSLFVVENKEYVEIKHISEETMTVEGTERHFRHIAVSRCRSNIKKTLRKEIKLFSPDVVIGVNTYPSFLAADVINQKIPFWADLNGWVMGEMQAQANSIESNAYIPHGYHMEQKILRRADKVSVVSTPQKYATYGELSFLGRLSKENFRHRHVEVVENACYPLTAKEKKRDTSVFRGHVFPADGIGVLWIGGFNAWADEETLFLSLTKAIKRDKRIHFLCTGGILTGIDEKKFPRFRQWCEESLYKNHFHFLGWVAEEDMPSLFHECSVGLNVDLLCVETEVGARNRINEMIRYALPIVTTLGSEISEIVMEESAGICCKNGDAEEISKGILKLITSKELQRDIKKSEETLIKTRFSATITQIPLLQWLQSPNRAPDNGKSVCLKQKIGILKAGIQYYRQKGLKSFLRKCKNILFG